MRRWRSTVVSMPAAAQSSAPAAPAAAAAGAPGAASAPSSLNVAVGGTITPGSCKPTLAEIKFNETKVNVDSLKDTAETRCRLPSNPFPSRARAVMRQSPCLSAAPVIWRFLMKTAQAHGHGHRGRGQKAISTIWSTRQRRRSASAGMSSSSAISATTTAANRKSTKTVVVTSADKATWATAADTTTHASQLKSDGSTFVTFAESGQSTVPVAAKSLAATS